MSEAGGRAAAHQLARAIGELLAAGEVACLVTLVQRPAAATATAEAPNTGSATTESATTEAAKAEAAATVERSARPPVEAPAHPSAEGPAHSPVEASAQAAGAKLLVKLAGAGVGTLGDARLDAAAAARAVAFLASRREAATLAAEEFAPTLAGWRGARVLFERVEPEPHVVVCGAGHVGASLARLARLLGYRVTVIDDRADFVTRERFPEEGVELLAADGGWTRAILETVGAGRGVSVAVVTRGHNEDEECMRAVLAARPDYVGMIGSRRRTNIVLGRLRESGFAEDELREVRAPVGLDIGAVSPEEVALSILAEIVARRRGGTCAPLSAWRRAE